MLKNLKNTQFNFLFLGISAAMPSFALGIPFGLWLLSAGVSKQTLGLVTVSSIIVALNFFWSPFINRIKLPVFYSFFGLRRSWILISQISLGTLLLFLSVLDPNQNLGFVVAVACLIYFFSSVQDIALDAYRVEYDQYFDAENLATIYQIGYKVGAFLIGAQVYGIIGAENWQVIYLYLGLLMFFLTSVTFLSMRVKEANLSESSFDQFFSAFKNLLNKNNVIILLLLVGIYKISDIILGPMAAALYVEVGLDNAEYLQKKSYFNFIATFVGSGLALWAIKKFQIEMTMFLGALLVVSTNMFFSYLYLFPSYFNFISINFLDTIAQAFTAVCFITYLVGQVDRRYTAIQYAFLASLVIIPGTLLKGTSGFLTDSLGFYNFFLLMGLIGAPSIGLSYLLIKGFAFNMQNNLRIVAIILIMGVFTFSLFEFQEFKTMLSDKFIHFFVYLLLSFFVFTASLSFKRILLFSGLISLGVITEFLQNLSGLRNFEYMDIIANSLGILVGLIIFIISKKTLKIPN